mgnify:CR=1 FL=1
MAIKDFKIKLGLSTLGNEFTVNTTLANTPALNVQAQTNTATLFVTTTANVGANVRVNTSGILIGNSTANLIVNSIAIVLGNSAANVTINTTSFSGTAANASTLNNFPSSYFVNASNMATGTVPVARLPTGSPSTAGILQIVDSIANTSDTIAASANSVKRAYDLAASAAGAAGVPGGSNTHVQTNDSGSFGGFDSFTYNKTTNTIFVGNSLVSATMNSTVFSKTANNASFFNGQPASFYANAENITSGTMAVARLPAASVSSAGVAQLVDAINNTSITIAATANSVKKAYDLALAANTLATAAQVAGSNTYVQFNDSGSYNGLASFTFNKTTNTISIGNTVTNATMNSTVYTGSSNNTTYLNGQLASFYTGLSSAAFTNAAARADAAYTNATSYADTKAATAFTNAASRADAAYTNATSYADTKAATAYSNATSYADTKAATAYSNAIAIAANASNLASGTVPSARITAASVSVAGIVRLVDSTTNTSILLAPTANALYTVATVAQAAFNATSTAYTNAVSYADTIAGTAFTNAAARAATAYSNGVSYTDTKVAAALDSWVLDTSGSIHQLIANSSQSVAITYTDGGAWTIGFPSGVTPFIFYSNGNFTCVSLTQSSDVILKFDIRPFNVGNKMERVSGVRYKLKDQPDIEQIGFIAQDMEKEFPELVHTNEQGIKGIDYSRATVVLWETIKDMKKEIREIQKIILNKEIY